MRAAEREEHRRCSSQLQLSQHTWPCSGASRSNTSTVKPCCASRCAVSEPAGPAPTITARGELGASEAAAARAAVARRLAAVLGIAMRWPLLLVMSLGAALGRWGSLQAGRKSRVWRK